MKVLVVVVVEDDKRMISSSDCYSWLRTMTTTEDSDSEQSASTSTMAKETSKEGAIPLEEAPTAAVNENPAEEAESQSQPPGPTPWQAIFSPQHNAYYFYNIETQETTWENPLLPSASSSSTSTPGPSMDPTHTSSDDPTAGSTNQYAALQAAAFAAGIDPSLAHLDPSLLSSLPSSSATSAQGLPPSFTAKFNARTGQFTRPDGRDPTHLSEHARMTRMSEFYFDVKGWEDELAQRGGSLMGTNGEEGVEGGKRRKRPSKKDLVGVFVS